jgi:hypothetical protein
MLDVDLKFRIDISELYSLFDQVSNLRFSISAEKFSDTFLFIYFLKKVARGSELGIPDTFFLPRITNKISTKKNCTPKKPKNHLTVLDTILRLN